MANTMRAALADGTGTYVVQDIPMPAMYEGAAMIQIHQTGICGSDLHMTTSRTEAQTLPSGHEIAGEILELPAGDHDLQLGFLYRNFFCNCRLNTEAIFALVRLRRFCL